MKIIICLYSLLLLQVNAFFLDDFREAIYHAEKGFEKLVNDVVTDMKETLHCTISAVEHVLYLHGIFDEPSNYQDKCKSTPATYNVHDPASKQLLYQDYNTGKDFKDEITQQVHKSISKVNETLSHLLDHNGDSKFKTITDALANETTRLNEVSKMLRNELEKISKNLKNGMATFNYDRNSPKDEILSEIKMLEDIENNSQNNSVIKEAHDALGEALRDLTSYNKRDDSLNIIIDKLQKDLGNKSEVIKDSREKPKSNEAVQEFRDKEDSLFNHESFYNDFESFFASDTENDPKAIEQVKLVIEDSKYTDRFFKSISNTGISVFDSNFNMDLFKF